MHQHWSPEVSECVKSGDKVTCSDLILAVGHNAARMRLQAFTVLFAFNHVGVFQIELAQLIV